MMAYHVARGEEMTRDPAVERALSVESHDCRPRSQAGALSRAPVRECHPTAGRRLWQTRARELASVSRRSALVAIGRGLARWGDPGVRGPQPDDRRRRVLSAAREAGIEFGEPAVDALTREFREEIGAGLEGIRYLDTFESIYVFDGCPGHELVRVYEARLADASLYERDAWTFEIEDGSTCDVLWKQLEDFRNDRLYPDGLLRTPQPVTERPMQASALA